MKLSARKADKLFNQGKLSAEATKKLHLHDLSPTEALKNRFGGDRSDDAIKKIQYQRAKSKNRYDDPLNPSRRSLVRDAVKDIAGNNRSKGEPGKRFSEHSKSDIINTMNTDDPRGMNRMNRKTVSLGAEARKRRKEGQERFQKAKKDYEDSLTPSTRPTPKPEPAPRKEPAPSAGPKPSTSSGTSTGYSAPKRESSAPKRESTSRPEPSFSESPSPPSKPQLPKKGLSGKHKAMIGGGLALGAAGLGAYALHRRRKRKINNENDIK